MPRSWSAYRLVFALVSKVEAGRRLIRGGFETDAGELTAGTSIAPLRSANQRTRQVLAGTSEGDEYGRMAWPGALQFPLSDLLALKKDFTPPARARIIISAGGDKNPCLRIDPLKKGQPTGRRTPRGQRSGRHACAERASIPSDAYARRGRQADATSKKKHFNRSALPRARRVLRPAPSWRAPASAQAAAVPLIPERTPDHCATYEPSR